MTTERGGTSVADAQQRLVRLMDGYLSTQLLYLAARLGIADVLASGPRTSGELARLVGADAGHLYRILRGLVIDGVLDELDDGTFGLAPVGALLRTDAPGSSRGAIIARGDLYYGAAAGLLTAAQQGGSAFEHVYGMELFDYLERHPDRAAEFQRSMVARSRREAAAVVAAYDFRAFRSIVDVGGGYGILLSTILAAAPETRGVLFDRPEVVGRARAEIHAAGLLPRCELVAGDFFTSVPDGGDAYLLSRVIHDWDDERAGRILANCRQAMPDGARLLLVEAVMPARPRERPGAVRMDLHMLTLLRGRERTEPEWRALLAGAGLELLRTVTALEDAGLCLLEARSVGLES